MKQVLDLIAAFLLTAAQQTYAALRAVGQKLLALRVDVPVWAVFSASALAAFSGSLWWALAGTGLLVAQSVIYELTGSEEQGDE